MTPLSTGAVALILAACVIAGVFIVLGSYPAGSGSEKILPDDSSIALPSPCVSGRISVEEALGARRSVREFSGEPLTIAELAQLLWAAQGITSQSGFRTAPSAGALYPLEVYISCSNVTGLLPGVYRYNPDPHTLEPVIRQDVKNDLYLAALRQTSIRDAPAVIVIAADYNRTTRKYGERGIRYVHMEAGHASENIYLEAYVLRIGTVAIGAFDDNDVRSVLAMPQNQTPLYLMPVGKVGNHSL